MTHDDYQRIAEAMLDDQAQAAERHAFAEHLAADPDARAAWDELLATRAPLTRAGLASLPPGLHGDIVRAVRQDIARRREGPAWLRDLLDSVRMRPFATATATFASGIALGAVLLAAFTGGLGEGGAVGARLSAAMGGTLRHAETLEAGGARLVLRTGSEGARLRLRAEGTSTHGAEIRLAWTPSALRLEHTRWPDAVAGPSVIGAGEMVVVLERAATWDLTFEPVAAGPHTVRVHMRTTGVGGEVVEQDLRLSP